MRRRKKARTITATLDAQASERLAVQVCPMHQAQLDDGGRLSAKSRLWKRADGTWTARFVYQRPDDPGWRTIIVVKGIVIS